MTAARLAVLVMLVLGTCVLQTVPVAAGACPIAAQSSMPLSGRVDSFAVASPTGVALAEVGS